MNGGQMTDLGKASNMYCGQIVICQMASGQMASG